MPSGATRLGACTWVKVGKRMVKGPVLEKYSSVLPMPSEPLTAPAVSTPVAMVWGETRPPEVDTDKVVRPSPPAHSLRNLPAFEASGDATTRVYVPAGSVSIVSTWLEVAPEVDRHPIWVEEPAANQNTSNWLVGSVAGSPQAS